MFSAATASAAADAVTVTSGRFLQGLPLSGADFPGPGECPDGNGDGEASPGESGTGTRTGPWMSTPRRGFAGVPQQCAPLASMAPSKLVGLTVMATRTAHCAPIRTPTRRMLVLPAAHY